MDNANSCETPEMTINRLQEENYKLNEELKLLNNKLIEYINIIKHIEYSVKLSIDQITHE